MSQLKVSRVEMSAFAFMAYIISILVICMVIIGVIVSHYEFRITMDRLWKDADSLKQNRETLHWKQKYEYLLDECAKDPNKLPK